MDLMEAIRERRSVREYGKRAIGRKKLDELIDALIWAPSSGNLQCRRFYFVFDQRKRRRLAKIAWDQGFIAEAPLAVVACADHGIRKEYGKRGVVLFSLLDVAASIQNMLLVAHSLGLATCWVGAFEEDDVRALLDLPGHLRPVSIVSVGYPAEDPEPPERVSRDQAVEFIR